MIKRVKRLNQPLSILPNLSSILISGFTCAIFIVVYFVCLALLVYLVHFVHFVCLVWFGSIESLGLLGHCVVGLLGLFRLSGLFGVSGDWEAEPFLPTLPVFLKENIELPSVSIIY